MPSATPSWAAPEPGASSVMACRVMLEYSDSPYESAFRADSLTVGLDEISSAISTIHLARHMDSLHDVKAYANFC